LSDRKLVELPALDPDGVPASPPNPYPEPFHSRMGGLERRALGDACRLERLGVNLVLLEPNAQSSLRHWHTLEDEFVDVLEGEVMLSTDAAEQVLRAGMSAGFPAGSRDAHHLINRSGEVVRYLEISNRADGDGSFYPEDDLLWIDTEAGWHAAHKDGRPYES
jgi:uncharacterized cupin superfamily protein